MEALAYDLRGQVPDLAGQFEESRPSQRRNSGFGLFTEMIVDRNRPAPSSGPTGDLGTVHAMVGGLPDPIAFKARLRHGVLLGLHGDSYGQDTRAIDFATVPFDEIFLVDDNGESIAFEPSRHRPPSPLLDLQKSQLPAPVPPPEPRLVNVGPLQKLQDAGRGHDTSTPAQSPALDILFGPRTGAADRGRSSRPYEGLAALLPASADSVPMSGDEKTSLRIGLWVALAAIGAVLVLAFRAPIITIAVVAILLGRFLQTEAGLRFLKRAIAEIRKHAKAT